MVGVIFLPAMTARQCPGRAMSVITVITPIVMTIMTRFKRAGVVPCPVNASASPGHCDPFVPRPDNRFSYSVYSVFFFVSACAPVR